MRALSSGRHHCDPVLGRSKSARAERGRGQQTCGDVTTTGGLAQITKYDPEVLLDYVRQFRPRGTWKPRKAEKSVPGVGSLGGGAHQNKKVVSGGAAALKAKEENGLGGIAPHNKAVDLGGGSPQELNLWGQANPKPEDFINSGSPLDRMCRELTTNFMTRPSKA